MQLSTNSTAAIRHEIGTNPTPAGRYRAAHLNWRDRRIALSSYQRQRSRHLLKVEQLRIHIAEIDKKLKSADDGTDAKRLSKIEKDMILLDIEEEESEVLISDEQVEDCVREMAAYQQLMNEISADAGVDFGALSADEFQHLMAIDHKQAMIRWLAAEAIAPALNLPPGLVAGILELSADKQDLYMREAVDLIDHTPLPSTSFSLREKPDYEVIE